MAAGGDEWVVEVEDAELKEQASRYLQQRRVALAGLRRALESGDFETLWIAGHHMHGAGGAFGVPRISELGAALEYSAWDRDAARVTEQLDQLEIFLEHVELV